jgi:sulfate permease, SulP family
MLVSVFVLAFFFLAVPLVPSIPLPVISGILLSSVCTMSHWREIPRLVKLSRRDACGWLATALLTITTDLLTAIAVGMLIGMFLYIQKHRLQPPVSLNDT